MSKTVVGTEHPFLLKATVLKKKKIQVCGCLMFHKCHFNFTLAYSFNFKDHTTRLLCVTWLCSVSADCMAAVM